MFVQVATDPGAWNIIWWILVLFVVGAAILWLMTTLLLRNQAPDATREGDPTGA